MKFLQNANGGIMSEERALGFNEGMIVPACGGTEEPFVVNGTRWLYVYQASSGRHGYYNMDTDIVEWSRDFHPAL